MSKNDFADAWMEYIDDTDGDTVKRDVRFGDAFRFRTQDDDGKIVSQFTEYLQPKLDYSRKPSQEDKEERLSILWARLGRKGNVKGYLVSFKQRLSFSLCFFFSSLRIPFVFS